MLLIADNLQLTLPAMARELAERDAAALQARIARLVAAGAEGIDINTGPLGHGAADHTAYLLETVTAVTGLPLLIDTLDPDALRAALEFGASNRIIINGFSLERARLERILPLAVRYDVDIIAYLLDERSHVPKGVDDRLETALALFQRATAAGLPPERLIIDPVVAPLNWPDAAEHNRSLLEVLKRLPEMLGFEVQTVASLSNLTTGPAIRSQKEALERVFVPMLAAHGLSMLLVNMNHTRSVATVRRCRWILDAGVFAWQQVDAREG